MRGFELKIGPMTGMTGRSIFPGLFNCFADRRVRCIGFAVLIAKAIHGFLLTMRNNNIIIASKLNCIDIMIVCRLQLTPAIEDNE
jgi:hypothetical protein